MKVEWKLFLYLTPFFFMIAVVYGLWSSWEPVGTTGLLLVGGLMGMIGFYLARLANHIAERPEDDEDGEITDGAGVQGVFAPWSWWPLAMASGAAICFLGLAVGWWLFGIGVVVGIIATVGWVFEFSTGRFSH